MRYHGRSPGASVSPQRFGRRAAALLVIGLLLLGACGDDSGTETATVCDARDELAASVEAVRDVDIVSDGTDAFRAAVDDVNTALDELGDAAQAEATDEVAAAEAAVDEFEQTVARVDSQSSRAAAASTVAAAFSTAAASIDDVMTALQPECG